MRLSAHDRIPRLGALAVLVDQDRVLLARRGKDPGRGRWGFPGGHVEWGETAMQAAVRELDEETSIRAEPVTYLTSIDLITPEPGNGARVHYLLVAVLCRYISGTPQAGDDAWDAQWFDPGAVRSGAVDVLPQVIRLMDMAAAR